MGIMFPEDMLFTIASPEFYEPLDQYVPDPSDFIDVVARRVPPDYEFTRRGIWMNCAPSQLELPPQGWKIHISATPANAAPILDTTTRLLVHHGAAFKFALDRFILLLLNNKRWSRGGAGKFITIYPRSVEDCGRLLEILSGELEGYDGPHILSDRRYKSSRVLHYRYGGFVYRHRMLPRGEVVPTMLDEEGHTIDDERLPFFRLPDGVSDPFYTSDAPTPQSEMTLREGRYAISDVLAFSSSGGVYAALDKQTGQPVVIKEARPLTGMTSTGTDSVWHLKKEHRILRSLADSGIAPIAIEYFKEWEHHYLVQEYVPGINLRDFMAEYALALHVSPSLEQAKVFYGVIRQVFTLVAEALQQLHTRCIVFGDISPYNVIVTKDPIRVTLIDFEGASEANIDLPTRFYTPGFAPQAVVQGTALPEASDDRYGLGSLLLAALMPINDLLALDSSSHIRILEAFKHDLSLPESLAELIEALMEADRAKRPPLHSVIDALREELPISPPAIGVTQLGECNLEELKADIASYILSTTTPTRSDKIIHGGPQMLLTNPLCVAYGGSGVALVLDRTESSVPAELTDWILSRTHASNSYPPGLFTGSAGVAWSMLEMGHQEAAEAMIAEANLHPLLHSAPGIVAGTAGWGMAQLRFFTATGDERYLRGARKAAAVLETSAHRQDDVVWWTDGGTESCGMAYGNAGIAVFLLYLSLLSLEDKHFRLGEAALRYVLDRGVRNRDGGLTWLLQEGHPTRTPYWAWGSAGVGMTVLRYNHVNPCERYESALSGIYLDAERKYSIFPGQFAGLAGIGEFWLDVARFRPQDRCIAKIGADKALSGLLLYRLKRPEGVAFPGESRTRISCDYASGGAGVLSFLHRYLHGGYPLLMLDEAVAPEFSTSRGFSVRHKGETQHQVGWRPTERIVTGQG